MSDDLAIAVEAARAAGELLRAAFRSARTSVATKSSGTDMVTDADRAAEGVILEILEGARPDDAVLGEEGGEASGSSGRRWVVDPLDGTTNFLFGIPHWAVSICCEDEAGPLAGVVYDPLRDELFVAERDAGATLNGTPCRVSDQRLLADALVATGFSYRADQRGQAAKLLPSILPRIRDLRRAGAAALDLAWVACGRHDAYFESPIEWWDVAAGSLLVAEAGGRSEPLPPYAGARGWVAAGHGVFADLRDLVLRARA